MNDDTSPARGAAPAPVPAGARLLFLQFAPGVTRPNAWTYLYSSFVAIALLSFLNFSQPYVLSEIVKVPPDASGRITGWLTTMQEVLQLLLAGLVGGLSDRFGRRTLYAIGFTLCGAGYLLYPLATNVAELFAFRFVYALGVAFCAVMIAVLSVDYPAERSRGKLGGVSGVLNALGVAIAAVLFSRLPAMFTAAGVPSAEAARDMLFAVAGVAFVTALAVQLGLRAGTPGQRRRRVDPLTTIRVGLRHGLENRRILLCFAGGFISRADLTLVATFISLWLQQVARNEGMTGAEAIARAGMLFGLIQGASLLWAPVVGILIDRVNRLFCFVVALLLAGIAYTFLGLQSHPFGPVGILGCVMVGIGQMSVIQSSQALLGQETPVDARGAVVGLAAFCGAAGILATSVIGGYLYDKLTISGPVLFVGLANLVVFTFGVVAWTRDGRPVAFDPAAGTGRAPAPR